MKKAYITPDVKAQTLEAQTMLASSTLTPNGDNTTVTVTPGDIIHNGEFDTNKDVWGDIW
ncbi:MAG: hypothetical protein IKA86_07080 [Paraprevotella sp.]|nr:hypothetical protein [Paraprevotella sp.]